MTGPKPTSRSPWLWIPSLYFAEGLPYALAMSVSLVLYKNLGVSNAKITFWTSLLGWPWVLKPLWSPVVDLLKTRREWIWVTQLIVGAALAGVRWPRAVALAHALRISVSANATSASPAR